MEDRPSPAGAPEDPGQVHRKQAFLEVLHADPSDTLARQALSQACRGSGELLELAHAFEELIAQQAADSPIRGELLGELTDLYRELADAAPEDAGNRHEFIKTSLLARRGAEARKWLEARMQGARESNLRAELLYDLAGLERQLGDAKRALRDFSRVVSIDPGPSERLRELVLSAARQVRDLSGTDNGGSRVGAEALRALLQFEHHPEAKHAAAAQLAALFEKHPSIGRDRAIQAYRVLARHGDPNALDQLEALAKKSKDPLALADALEQRARSASDPAAARSHAARAIALRSKKLDPTQALSLWQQHLQTYGPSREAHAGLLPLLESTERWAEVVDLLDRDAALATRAEDRATQLGHAGALALHRLGNPHRALAFFERALAEAPAEPRTLSELGALVRDGDHRLQAADVLERTGVEASPEVQLEILWARLELAHDERARAEAATGTVRLADALDLAPARRLEIRGRALAALPHLGAEELDAWLETMKHLAEASGDDARRAELLGSAALALTGETGHKVALAAAEALAATGQSARALHLYERALQEQPSSIDLVQTVDGLMERMNEPIEARLLHWDRAIAAASGPQATDLLFSKADALERSGDLPRAIELWQQIRRTDPAHWTTHTRLLAAYRQQGDSIAAYEELDRALGTFSGEQLAATRRRMAELLTERGELAEALVHYAELLESNLLDDTALTQVEQLADDVGDAELLCRVLQHRADRLEDPQDRATLLERLGELKMDRLGDEAGAMDTWRVGARLSEAAPAERGRARHLYERMVASAPNDRDAAERLVALYAESGEWERIPEALSILLRPGEDGSPPRVDLLLGLEEPAVAANAVDSFLDVVEEAIWQLGTENREVAHDVLLCKARMLARQPERTMAAAEVYRGIIESFGLAEDVQAFTDLIDRCSESDERREMQRWLLEWRAGAQGRDANLLKEWGDLERSAPAGAETAARLYREALELETRSEIVEALATVIDALEESLPATQYQALLRVEGTSLQARLAIAVRAARDYPREEPFWSTAFTLARELGEPDPVASAGAAALDGGLDAEGADRLGQQLVEFYDEWFGDSDRSTELLLRLLRVSPRSRWALDRLKLGLVTEKRYDELFSLYDEAIAHAESSAERADLLDEAALAAKDHAGDDARAILYLERLAVERPGDGLVDARLERLYDRQGRTEALVRLLERKAGEADGREAELLRERIAHLHVQLGDAARALSSVRALLETDPDRNVFHLLETVATLPIPELTDSDQTERGTRLGAASLLEQRYAEAGRLNDAMRVLGNALGWMDEDAERRRALERLVDVYKNQLGDARSAFENLERLVLLDPAPDAYRADLATLAAELDAESERVDILTRAAREVPPALAVELLTEAANTCHANLNDTPRAIDIYETALTISGAQAKLVRQTARPLAALLHAEGRFREQCDVLERLAAAERKREARIEALAQAAALALESLQDPDRAARLWGAVLELDPTHLRALDGRVRSLGEAQRWEELVQALQQRAEQKPLDEGRADRIALARVRADQLGDLAGAIDEWRAIRRDSGEDLASLHALGELLARADRFEELGELLEGRPLDQAETRALAARLATAYAGPLDDPDRARTIFAGLVEADSRDAVALSAYPTYVDLLERQGDATARGEVLEQCAAARAAAGDANEAVQQWSRAGEQWEAAHLPDRARAAYRRAGALGHAASLRALRRLLREAGNYSEAVGASERLFAAATDGERADTALELERDCLAAGDDARALEVLEEVLLGAQDTAQIRARLISHYRERNLPDPLAKVLRIEAASMSNAESKAGLLREAAALYLGPLQEPALAVQLLEQAYAALPADPTLESDLAEALSAAGRHSEANARFTAQLETYGTRRPRERSVVHWRYGQALVAQRREREAFEQFKLAVAIQPGHAHMLQALAELALELGELDFAESKLRTLLLALHHNDDPTTVGPTRAGVYLALRDVALRRDDATAAEDCIESAFEAALENAGAARAFEQLLRQRGEAALLGRAVEARLKQARTPDATLSVLADLAGSTEEPALEVRVRERMAELSRALLSSADPEGRARLLGLCHLYERYTDEDARSQRYRIAERLFGDDPEDPESARLFIDLTRRNGRPEQTLAALERHVGARSATAGDGDLTSELRELGILLALAERSDEAWSALSRALRTAPENADILRCLEALSETRENRPDEVAPILEKLRTIERGPKAAHLAVRVASLYRALGRDDSELLEILTQGFLEDPTNRELRTEIVAAHSRTEQWSKLSVLLQAALRTHPDDGALRSELVDAHRRAGDLDNALRVLEAELDAHPGDATRLQLRSELLHALGRIDESLQALEAAHAISAGYSLPLIDAYRDALNRNTTAEPVEAGLRLAELLLSEGEPEPAEAHLRVVLEQAPAEPRALEALATLAEARGDLPEAQSLLRRLLAQTPDPGAVALRLAEICERAGHPEDAVPDLRRAIEAPVPASPEVFDRLESLYDRSGQRVELAALLERKGDGIEDEEDAAPLWVRAAGLYLEAPEHAERAGPLLEKVLAGQPDHLEAAVLLARSEWLKGHRPEARTVLFHVLEEQAGARSADLATAHALMGELYLADDELVEAYESLESAFKMDKNNAETAYLFGLVALDVDRLDSAARALRTVIALTSRGGLPAEKRSIAYYHLARLADWSRDKPRARLMAHKALQENPNNTQAKSLADALSPHPKPQTNPNGR